MSFSENIGQAIVEIIGDPTNLHQSLEEVKGSLKETGKILSDVGKTLSVGITAPLTGMAAAAISTSSSFESAFAGVAKTVDASEAQLAQLESQFRQLATTIPVSTETLFGLGQAAGQLGIRTENIIGFATTMAMMADSTDLSADRAATALARIAAITQLPQEQISNLASTMVALGNTVAATESEIVEMSLRIAGAGSQIGLTQAQIAGFAAALAAVGIQAEAGGTAVSNVMLQMREAVVAGGEQLEGFARIAGMSAQQFANAFRTDPSQAIIAFVQGLQQMTAAGEPTQEMLRQLGLGGIRTGDALRRLGGAGDLVTQTMATATQAFAQNTALQDEFARRVDTTAARTQILRNNIREAAATLGDALQPMFNQVLEVALRFAGGLTGLAQAFGNLSPPIQQTIIVAGALLAALGPALLLMGQLVGAIINLSTGIGLAWPLISTLASALGSVITVVGQVVVGLALLNPIVTAIAVAVGVLAAAWIRDWGGIRTFTLQTLAVLQQAAATLGTSLSTTWASIHTSALTAWIAIQNMLVGVWNTIRTTIQSGVAAVQAVIIAGWSRITSQSASAWDNFQSMLSAAWGSIKVRAISAFQSMGAGINAVWHSIVAAAVAARDAIIGIISSIADRVSGLIHAIGRVREAGARAVASARAAIPGLQSGGTIVRPGLALVGERGPEIVRLPRGAEVLPLGQRQSIGEGAIQLVQYITAAATPQDLQRYTERALRRLATEFALGV